jgi:hypothetical protein
MFEDLYDIDWKSLNAEDVPKIIEQLVAEDRGLRKIAYEDFDSRVLYNNNTDDWQEINAGHYISKILVSDLQLRTIPFLDRIIKHPKFHNKEVYDFLLTFVYYSSMKDEGEIYKQRAFQIKEEIWKNIDGYLPDLSSKDLETRVRVFSLLCRYTDKARELTSVLLDSMRVAEIPYPKKRMIVLFDNSFVAQQMLTSDEMEKFLQIKQSIMNNKTS